MSYTRLSINFQPKTAQPPRRWFLSAGLAAWAGWYAGGMMPPVAGARASTLAVSTTQNLQATPPMTQSLTDEDGAVFTLNNLRGRPLLINFWASWCAPCIAEMPSLQKAADQLHPDGIDVLLISLDRGGVKKALPVLRAHGVTTPRLGFDPKAAFACFSIRLPMGRAWFIQVPFQVPAPHRTDRQQGQNLPLGRLVPRHPC
jgi:thiol-disulfide isomerase/thioredoxin